MLVRRIFPVNVSTKTGNVRREFDHPYTLGNHMIYIVRYQLTLEMHHKDCIPPARGGAGLNVTLHTGDPIEICRYDKWRLELGITNDNPYFQTTTSVDYRITRFHSYFRTISKSHSFFFSRLVHSE